MQRRNISTKTEGVILSYYVAGCIMNPNKRTGRSDCLPIQYNDPNSESGNLEPRQQEVPDLSLDNRFGISYPMYEKMLHSGVYNKLRHNHKLEKENEAKTEENLEITMSKFIKRLATFQHYKPLLSQLVTKDIKLKYRRLPRICMEYLKPVNDHGNYGTRIFQHVPV